MSIDSEFNHGKASPHPGTDLDHNKTGTRSVRTGKVDIALVIRDIEALNAGLGNASGDKE